MGDWEANPSSGGCEAGHFTRKVFVFLDSDPLGFVIFFLFSLICFSFFFSFHMLVLQSHRLVSEASEEGSYQVAYLTIEVKELQAQLKAVNEAKKS